jgi:NADH dehydrogenase
LANKAKLSLERLRVEVRTNAKVEEVDAGGVVVSGERICSQTVIWAAGVTASPAGKWIGAETDRAGRVKVNPDLTVPGQPNIYVIGDVASVADAKGRPLPGLAPVAMQQGKYVGASIARRINGENAIPPFRYVDKGNLATIGRSAAIAEIGRLRLSGFVAWIVWLTVHIFYLIGFRNRVLVLLQWAWAYLTFQRSARLITLIESKNET